MTAPHLDVPAGGPVLPAAVPEYIADPGLAERTLGRAYLYVAQLSAEMVRRAEEANAVHDDNVRLRAEVAALQSDIDEARARLAEGR